MYQVSAFALRQKGIIEVSVFGFLPDSCYKATIVEIYPGGNRFYIRDPGFAQVFIEEQRYEDAFCPLALVPWLTTTQIPDDLHAKVQIFINDEEVLQVTVLDEPTSFSVIALAVLSQNSYFGCSIVPQEANYPKLYRPVYGPDTYENCLTFISESCVAS